MYKKILFTIACAVMSISLWAQTETVLFDGGDGITNAGQFECNPSTTLDNIEEGDILKVYYEVLDPSNYGIRFASPNNWTELFGFSNTNPSNDTYTLHTADADNIKTNGLFILWNNQLWGLKLLKLTLIKPVYEDATGVTLSQTSLTLDYQATATLTATVEPAGAKQGITWEVIGGNGCVTVDDNGKVTGNAAGTATVRAHAKSNYENIYADCEVTVNGPVSIASITLSPETATIKKGESVTFTPTILPTNTFNKNLNWSVSDGSVAYVNNGVVTGNNRGTTTVTATSQENPEVSATATLIVQEQLEPSYVSPRNSYYVGEEAEFSSFIGLSNPYYGTITLSSSNPEVLSVDGKLVALKEGAATITITVTPTAAAIADYYLDTNWTKDYNVTVKKHEYGLALVANPSSIQLNEATTVTVTPSITLDGNGTGDTNYSIEYSLENAPSGVTINATTGVVTVPAIATPQQFNIVATLTPNDPTNYTGATAEANISIFDKNAIVTVSVDAEGTYTVNIPYGGAFGALDDNPEVVLNNGATIDGLKNTANVKVTGLLANSDMRELIHLIGDDANATQNVCTSLDMSGATMTEEVTSHNAYNDSNVPSISWIDDSDYWTHRLNKLQSLSLPNPATPYTIIPSNMFALWNVNNTTLSSLTIPEGWTEVKANAFANTAGNGMQALTSLSMPNSLQKIGAHAFSGLMVHTIYMPNNLQVIDDGAFNPSLSLSDVYFTGPAPRYVHKNAFGADTQQTNNTVDDNDFNGQFDPTADRSRYAVGEVLACIMHFPDEYKSQYVDETRVYKTQDPNIPYGKGNQNEDNKTSFIPEGWTQDMIDYVNSKRDPSAAYQALLYVDCGVKDATYGSSLIWPSQGMMTSGYTIAHAGYTWAGQPMDPETQYNPEATPDNGLVDRRGLYQFIVTIGNAPTDKDKWTFKDCENDLWYTIALPFDMSVAQIKKVFGSETQVCRISKVTRDTSNSEKKVLKLEFRKSVMEEEDSRPKDITYDDGISQAGIRHHYPYMIKPSGDDAEQEFIEAGHRVLPGYKSIPGVLQKEIVNAVDNNDRNTDYKYEFSPILQKGSIKKNSYILTKENKTSGKHVFVFYRGTLNENTGLYEDGGTASANTAYVQLVNGQADSDDFFPIATVNGAKVNFASFFGDDMDDTTDIDEIEIVCGDDVDDNKVYTISGILVNGNSLAPGIYIKNGKKYIVK